MFHMHNLGPHILSDFDKALDSLRGQISMMASLTERGLRNAEACSLLGDQRRGDTAIADDAEIEVLEDDIRREADDLLSRFQPVASDSRRVTASIRLSAIIKHVADRVVEIARHARLLCVDPPLTEIEWLRAPWRETMMSFSTSIDAYASSDVPLDYPSRDHEQNLDDTDPFVIQLRTAMINRPDRIPDYLNLLIIRCHLKEVCDHAKSILDEAAYLHRPGDTRLANNPLTRLDSD